MIRWQQRAPTLPCLCVFLSAFLLIQKTDAMRGSRMHVSRHSFGSGKTRICARPLVRPYATQDDSSADRAFADHQARLEAKRKQTWERIKQDVDQRAAALRAKAAQHQAQEAMLRAQLAHHIRSARVYQTLADLEHEKFRLFALTLEKLHEASRYCQELDLSTETQLLETLEQTYCQLYDSLPEDEKI